jgi:hypothetical protein
MPAPSGALARTQDIASALVRMSEAELAETYRAGTTAPIPNGRARGVALVLPGSSLSPILAKIGWLVWQGKNFDDKAARLSNRVIGLRFIPGALSHGPSWFDSGNAVIIDYKHTSMSFSRIRDEIRLIAPDFWLGRTYYRRGERGSYVWSFGLDFRA